MSGFAGQAQRLVRSPILAAGILVALAALVLLASRAVSEWRNSTAQLVDQRAEEVLTLLVMAVNRDLKGVHTSVLAPLNERDLDFDAPYDLADKFARAFAEFPYPESFFTWKDTGAPGGLSYVFNRVDRLPPWDASPHPVSTYPVVTLPNLREASELIRQARAQADSGDRFAVFSIELAGIRYEAVVHLMYYTSERRQLFGLAGFTVNPDWVRRHYFTGLLNQIASIGGQENLTLRVLDDSGAIAASTSATEGLSRATHRRQFQFAFVEPTALSTARYPPIRLWTASVAALDDQSLASATRGATRTLWLVGLAAGAATLGLILTLQAVQASARLATMKSDFVSSATHELKTPLALIKLVSDTLLRGRYHSEAKIQEYAKLLGHEVDRLSHLIDNLLAFASLSDVDTRYHFEPLSIAEIAEAALERFDARLVATELEAKVSVPSTLPRVRADRQTIIQVFENIIDNALKYSPGAGTLIIRAEARGRMVHVEIADQGIGIPTDERADVFKKFFRGSNATASGSGLGLAIVRSVIDAHQGMVDIHANQPVGTIVDVALPIAEVHANG